MATIRVKCKECKELFDPSKTSYKATNEGIKCEKCLKQTKKKLDIED